MDEVLQAGGRQRHDELFLDPHRRYAALQAAVFGQNETKMQLLAPSTTTAFASPLPPFTAGHGGTDTHSQDPATGQWIDVAVNIGTAVLYIYAEQASARPLVPRQTQSANRYQSRPRLVQFRKHANAAVGIAIRGGSEIELPIVISKVHPTGAAASGSDLVCFCIYIYKFCFFFSWGYRVLWPCQPCVAI